MGIGIGRGNGRGVIGTGTGRPDNGCGIGIPGALGGGMGYSGNSFGRMGCVDVLGFSGTDRGSGVNG